MLNGNIMPIKTHKYTLQERLKDLRKSKGLNQLEVAEKCNIGEKTYRDAETKGKPSVSTLIALSDFYGVSVDYLLCRTDYTNTENDLIGNETGLSNDAIETIKYYNNCSKRNPVDVSLNMLNCLLSNKWSMLRFLNDLRTYFKPRHTIPVIPVDDSREWVICDQMRDIDDKTDINYIYLSESRDDIVNPIPFPINETFLNAIAYKNIEKDINTFKEIYLKHFT